MSFSDKTLNLAQTIGTDVGLLKSSFDSNVNSETVADFVYTNGMLTRINYISGNYTIFTYVNSILVQKDYYKGSSIYRTILIYTQDGSLSSFAKTIHPIPQP